MKIDKVTAVYFSPTKGSKTYVCEIAKRLCSNYESINLTNIEVRRREYLFTESDLVIFGAPVYAGRLPSIEDGIFDRIHGSRTPAIFTVSYGNREYEDALLEMKDLCESNGFSGIAAAAWIAPHTFSGKIASGRPDSADINQIKRFTDTVRCILQKDFNAMKPLQVSGNRPYRNLKPMPFYPKGNKNCTACGACAAVCPTGAIVPEEPRITKEDKCIDCFACVKICPKDARAVSNPIFESLVSKLEGNLIKTRKEPQFFYEE